MVVDIFIKYDLWNEDAFVWCLIPRYLLLASHDNMMVHASAKRALERHSYKIFKKIQKILAPILGRELEASIRRTINTLLDLQGTPNMPPHPSRLLQDIVAGLDSSHSASSVLYLNFLVLVGNQLVIIQELPAA